MSRLRNPLVAGLLATLVVGGLAGFQRCGVHVPLVGQAVETLERWTADMRFLVRGETPTAGRTAIVVFDDKTLEKDPTLFERRVGWVRVLRALERAGARVIGIDALFADPERLLSPDLVGAVDAYLGSASGADRADEPVVLLQRVQHETHADDQLVRAVASLGNVFLALHIGYAGAPAEAGASGLRKGRYGQVVPGPYRPEEMEGVVASLPRLNEAARGLGTVTVFEDSTYSVREMRMAIGYRNGIYLPLALHLVARYDGMSRGQIAYLASDHTVRLGKRTLPLNEQDGFFLNFRGPGGTFPTYSVADLLEDGLPADALRDRIVLVGITYFGHDKVRTPFDRVFPGVEIQATAIDNILAGDPIHRAPPWLDALFCLGMGVLVAFLFWRRLGLSPWIQAPGVVVLVWAHIVLSQLLFTHADLWLFVVGPAGTGFLVGGLCLALSYYGEEQERRRIRSAFSHYLSDDVIHQLLAEPGALSLGGERRELTVLFSDIRGFTNISEHARPEELVSALNTYFTPMTRAVLAQGGFLDKYIGDALMAVFGAPVHDPRHPANALGCALTMHAELQRLKPALESLGVQIDIGVGINTGEMIVGNMGSEERFDYTVVGDSVNLASRLEGLTKVYDVFCLVGERTAELAGDEFVLREVDRVQVKGKSLAASVFELLSGPDGAIAAYRDLDTYRRGLQAFRGRDLRAARAAFRDFAAKNPQDGVARVYLEKLERIGDEPPEGWSDISVYLTK